MLLALSLLIAAQPCDSTWLQSAAGGAAHWQDKQLPLLIAMDPGSDSQWGAAVRAAAQTWNALLNREVFAVMHAPVASEAAVTLRDAQVGIVPAVLVPFGTNPHLRYELLPSGQFLTAILRLPIVEWTDAQRYEIAIHELGHALGLEHDQCNDSIMFPSYRPEWTGRVNVTSGDLERLRERYKAQ